MGKGVYSKVSTLTFEKKIDIDPARVADNVLEYLQQSYKKESMDIIMPNMEAQGWTFKEISHKIFDNMNDVIYDSKIASQGLTPPSRSLTTVLRTIASYIKEEGRTLEEAKVARDLSKRLQEALS